MRACRPSDLSARPGSERAVFFLTDGDDNRTSEYSYGRLGGMARERRIAVYTFVLGGDVGDAKYRELEAMSLDAGGKCCRGSQDDLAGYTGIIFDETVDYATDSNEGGISGPCSGEGRRRVDSRTLAIFSALSYEDGTEAMRRSGFYGEIVGSPPEEPGERYYFLDGASVKPGGSDDYVRDWVVAEYDNVDVPPLIGARFSATVYVHGDDVVLAYRGTSEDPEWLNDLSGGLSNFTLEEPYAKLMALRAARMYAAPRRNVYITGHSLGGYLAQVGAAELIRSGCADMLRSCEYFNGMGLDYGRMSPSLPDQYQHASERELLSGWGARTGGLVLHRIFGDPVSLLGIHSGKIRLYAADECVRHHKGIDYDAGDCALPAGALVLVVGPEPILAAELYGIGWGGGLMTYMWSVHETDSFLYADLRS